MSTKGCGARAEAGLAWLNCRLSLISDTALSPSLLLGPLLDNLDAALTDNRLQIAHLKVVDDALSGFLKASLIRNGDEPLLQGDLTASPVITHDLLLNIRASGEPALLQSLVQKQISELPGKLEIRSMQCFKPSAPKPEYRICEAAGGLA